MATDWTPEELELLDLAGATAREGGHATFLASLLLTAAMQSRRREEIVAEIERRMRPPRTGGGDAGTEFTDGLTGSPFPR